MAKKGKREVEEITEEVIDEKEEAADKKTARRKKNRSSKKKEEPVKEEEEETSKPATKKKKGKGRKGDPVKALLKELDQAKEDGDQVEARRIRKDLRAEGYSLRGNNK